MKNKLASVFGRVSEHKEIFIVVLVLMVLAMIIVPIPHALMDVLIGVNISLTVIVLMVVIYMRSPLEVTSFPSILLMLALFRIGITISSSRLILLDGDAGQIIATFGEFVVGGNIVVGIIIFSIITLINFIVITKGSERVAEVAARFSLDAMPGKQMSIDSDLKAGNIDMEEAQRRRSALGLESKLYGAMDGAMKFVKGDAIASIIDIVINLAGGLAIGVLQKGLNFGDALHLYSILTIGDGLVQQIPALLISMTAGMMITRVSDDNSKEKENLGVNIINQLFKNPKALISASILFVMLAAIPGMPSITFIIFFVILLIFALFLRKNIKLENADGSESQLVEESNTSDEKYQTGTTNHWKLQPLILNVATNLKSTSFSNLLKQALVDIHGDVLSSLGVEIPKIIIRYSKNLEDSVYELLLFEIPISSSRLYNDRILLLDCGEEVLVSLAVTDGGIPNSVDIGLIEQGVWIPARIEKACTEYELRYLTVDQFITCHLSTQIKANVADFLGIQEVKDMFDKMPELQELIKELLRMIPLNKITEIFQRLVVEGISIRNFKVILDALLEWAQRERETVVLTEYVRQSLGRYIVYKYTKGSGLLSCFLIDSELEDLIRDAIRFNEGGSYLSIDPEHSSNIIEATQNLYDKYKHLQVSPVIITQMDVRRYLRSILEKALPYAHVLSFQEVEKYVSFNTLGVIEI